LGRRDAVLLAPGRGLPTERDVLKAIIAKLEDAPENVRSLYRAGTADEGTDGKFVLNVDPTDGFALENVEGLKTALSAERTEHGKTRQKVKAFEGIDPEKAKAAIAKVDELGDLDPKKDVDRLVEEKVGAQLSQLNERHADELSARDKKIQGRDALLRKALVHDAALKAIISEKGDPDLLLPHVLPTIHLDLDEDDSGNITPKIKVIDAAGNVRIGDSQGNPMKIEQLVGEFKKHDKFSKLFEGDGVSGTGERDEQRRRSNGGGGDQSGRKLSQMSRKDKAALISEIGLPAFNQRVSEESRLANAE